MRVILAAQSPDSVSGSYNKILIRQPSPFTSRLRPEVLVIERKHQLRFFESVCLQRAHKVVSNPKAVKATNLQSSFR